MERPSPGAKDLFSGIEAELGLTDTIPLLLKPRCVFFGLGASSSHKCFLITQIFSSRKPAEIASPSAVPMRAYLISEEQGEIEQKPSTYPHSSEDLLRAPFSFKIKSQVSSWTYQPTKANLISSLPSLPLHSHFIPLLLLEDCPARSYRSLSSG